jgi:hypothetical protein
MESYPTLDSKTKKSEVLELYGYLREAYQRATWELTRYGDTVKKLRYESERARADYNQIRDDTVKLTESLDMTDHLLETLASAHPETAVQVEFIRAVLCQDERYDVTRAWLKNGVTEFKLANSYGISKHIADKLELQERVAELEKEIAEAKEAS